MCICIDQEEHMNPCVNLAVYSSHLNVLCTTTLTRPKQWLGSPIK